MSNQIAGALWYPSLHYLLNNIRTKVKNNKDNNALKATIFKADVSITDLDRNYFADHSLTIARHPSESDERMMLRLIAFILNADERLEFTKGLSEVDDPDIWRKDFSEQIELWVELGTPSEQRVKKGCNQSQLMRVYSYADNSYEEYLKKEQGKLGMKNNLEMFSFDATLASQLAELANRNMQIQVTIQDGALWFNLGNDTLEITPTKRI